MYTRLIRPALVSILLTALSGHLAAQPEVWEKLNKEGEELYYKSEYQKAKDCFVRGLAMAGKVFGKNHASYATACDNLAFINSMLGSYEEAEKLFLESKSIRERVIGKSQPDYGTTCVNLADVYNALGRYDEAEALYLEASGVFKKNPGENSMEFALVTNNLAGLYFVRGDYQKTETMYLKAREIWIALNGKESNDYATSCNNLGSLYQQMGNYALAESNYQESLKIIESLTGTEDPAYATSCNNLGDLYRELEDFYKSEPLYLKAMEIRRKSLGEDHPLYAQSCVNVGLLYQDVGQYAKAEQFMLKGKQVYLTALGKENVEYGNSCTLMGALYRALGNYTKAEEFYLEGLNVFAKALGEEHSDYAQACNDLAGFYRSQRKFTQSESYYLTALRVRKKIYGEDHPSYGATINNLGLLYADMKQYDKARPLYEESKRILLLRSRKNDAAYGRNMNNVGMLDVMSGKLTEAEPLLQEARQNYEQSLGKDHPDYSNACNNLANLYVTERKYELAEPLYAEVTSFQLKQIGRNFTSLSENEQQLYYQSIKSTFNGFGAFAVHYYPLKRAISGDLYDLRLNTKGLIFRGTLKTRQKILESKDTALIGQLEQSLAMRNYLAKVYRMSAADREKRNINLKTLEDAANQMEKDLNTKASSLGIKDLAEEQAVTWRDVQGRLSKKEAAVEVVRVQTSRDTLYAALIIKPESSSPELVMLRPPKELEGKAMNFYRNCVMNQVEDRNSYEAFWKSVAPSLKGVRKVFFSADGVYHQINLATLINPQSGRYLGDELLISVVGSTRDLVKRSPLPLKGDKRTGKVGLYGFPNYSGKGTGNAGEQSFASSVHTGEWTRYLDTQTRTVPVLPGTRVEVESIHRLLEKNGVVDDLHTGSNASERLVKAARNPRTLHIATHGFFLPGESSQGRSSGNPLLRSGLLLADCEPAMRGYRVPDGEEDGILTAYEAMNLFLEGTDLVVLSACETGLGEIQNGEGVYGLQRAFRQAGAHAVMMSLWKVDDATTQLLMTRFYEEYLRHGDKSQALLAAQKAVRARYPQPYYWGAFVLMGD